jgi:hypothetical protein
MAVGIRTIPLQLTGLIFPNLFVENVICDLFQTPNYIVGVLTNDE